MIDIPAPLESGVRLSPPASSLFVVTFRTLGGHKFRFEHESPGAERLDPRVRREVAGRIGERFAPGYVRGVSIQQVRR